jgi:hypothetical protein
MKSGSSDGEAAPRKKPVVATQMRDPPDAFSLLGLDGSAQMRNTLVDGIFDRKRKKPIG